MFQFTVKCGKESVQVKYMVADCLCINFRKKNYLIRHCSEGGWILCVGKMPTDRFGAITGAVEEYILQK
jgi:hypothetical protein